MSIFLKRRELGTIKGIRFIEVNEAPQPIYLETLLKKEGLDGKYNSFN